MYCVHILKDDSMKEIKIKGNDILKTLNNPYLTLFQTIYGNQYYHKIKNFDC